MNYSYKLAQAIEMTSWFSYSTPPNKNKPGWYECDCGARWHHWHQGEWWKYPDNSVRVDISPTTVHCWRGLGQEAK